MTKTPTIYASQQITSNIIHLPGRFTHPPQVNCVEMETTTQTMHQNTFLVSPQNRQGHAMMGNQQLGRRRRETSSRSNLSLYFKSLAAINVFPALIAVVLDTTWLLGSLTTITYSVAVAVVEAFVVTPQPSSRWTVSQGTHDNPTGCCRFRRRDCDDCDCDPVSFGRCSRRALPSLNQAVSSARRRSRHGSAIAVSEKSDIDGTTTSTPPTSSSNYIAGGRNTQHLQLQQRQPSSSTSSRSLPLPLTNAVIRISYDGTRFTGWSSNNKSENKSQLTDSQKRRRRRRSKKRGVRGEFYSLDGEEGDEEDEATRSRHGGGSSGFVRSVEFVLKQNLAKIYGNVDLDRVVVEGCSRTDKGVHATGMIAHIYCLSKDFEERGEGGNTGDTDDGDNTTQQMYVSSVIPGKRKPHPTSSTDDVSGSLQTMPFKSNLSRLAFALNRMRPADLQITGISPTPVLMAVDDDDDFQRHTPSSVFHASTSSVSKTYEYRITTGQIYDPTRRRTVWHTQREPLDLNSMKQACAILEGEHDFSAFQGTPRGSEDRKKRRQQQQKERGQSICHMFRVTIEEEEVDQATPYFDGVDPPIQYYKIIVKGDRFLYKMVRFLVGAIVAVGSHKLYVSTIEHALKQGNWLQQSLVTTTIEEGGISKCPEPSAGRQRRRHEFECAPPHGLVLSHIDYGPEVKFDWQPIRDSTKQK